MVKKLSVLKTKATGGRDIAIIPPGALVFPTGQRKGHVWQVEDAGGLKGWISSKRLMPNWSP